MSIATEITKLNTNLTASYTACDNKGATMPASQNFDNLATCISSIPEATTPTLATLTVTPSTTAQILTPPSGTDGYNTVSVSAVTASIDSDIVAGNIKSGVNILGVNGSVTELVGETRTVSITSTSGNTFTPSSGKNGITSIKVNPTNQNLTITPTTTTQTFTVPSNYSGYGTVTCNASGGGNILSYLNNNYIVKSNGDIEAVKKENNTLSPTATTINTASFLLGAYSGNESVIKANLSSLTTISGSNALQTCFLSCTKLISVDLSSLTIISGQHAMNSAFYGCTGLTTLSFPSLTSTSFGSYRNQFNGMLISVTGCTVHFPSNLQSVIGSWSSVIAGFGGTNTTVLFDLPATT